MCYIIVCFNSASINTAFEIAQICAHHTLTHKLIQLTCSTLQCASNAISNQAFVQLSILAAHYIHILQ